MSTHARRSPSSASRWMNCPGSIRAIDALPPEERDRKSHYAEEGTAAHRVAEECLRRGIPAEELLGYRVGISDELGAELYKRDGDVREHEYEVSIEMVEAVNVYLEDIRRAKEELPFGEVVIEARVRAFDDLEEPHGTLDFSIYDPVDGLLIVNDYKHGAGVKVNVENNTQALTYAAGRIREIGVQNIREVELRITQPRAPGEHGVKSWKVSAADVMKWRDEVLRPAVLATDAPDAPLVPGDHCRFCPAAPTCIALRRKVIEETQHDFDVLPATTAADAQVVLRLPDASNPEQVAAALRAVDVIDGWCREVEGLAQRMLERGQAVPGFKLVRKKSNRAWTDEKALVEAALALPGVKKADLYDPPKLKSPAKLEVVKAIGKPWVAEKCYKPEGGLTIAAEADARPAVPPPAIADFQDVSLLPGNSPESEELFG